MDAFGLGLAAVLLLFFKVKGKCAYERISWSVVSLRNEFGDDRLFLAHKSQVCEKQPHSSKNTSGLGQREGSADVSVQEDPLCLLAPHLHLKTKSCCL